MVRMSCRSAGLRWATGFLVGLAVVSAVAVSVAGAQTVQGPPLNTAAPSIAGVARLADTLSVNVGHWDGTSPITFSYQWFRCDPSGGGCSSITGATASTYVLNHFDVGHRVRVSVKAFNAVGSAEVVSSATDLVGATSPSAVPPPGGTPSSVRQCKHDGWRVFTNPSFRNQGQCVRFVRSQNGRKNGHGDENHGHNNQGQSNKGNGERDD